MGFDFTGHVLRAPRLAPGNASTSSDPINGVVRDVRIPPATRTAAQPEVEGLPGTQAMVDLAGDQYRVAVLQALGTTPREYLVWVANTSQLALVDDPSWWTALGSGRIPVGTGTVQNLVDPTLPYSDGTTRAVITDNGGREIGTVTHLVVARGDKTYDDDGWVDIENPASGRKGSVPYEVVVLAAVDQVASAGLVFLTDTNVYTATGTGLVPGDLDTVLGGGLSLQRGDAIVGVRYTVAPLKFWWTRNDRYETRFGWNGKYQRWMPYKGSAPVNLGQLLFDTDYTLSPKMRTLPLGAVLTGDAASSDEYAVVRLGTSPGALSQPVGVNDPDGFTGIEVVSDADVEEYDFSGKSVAGVVGQNSGKLKFNPLFVEIHAGKVIWYVYGTFSAEANGQLGLLLGADTTPLYLAPVPGPTDHPFIRIANRSPLAVVLVATEALLEQAVDPAEGSCIVALSTGRLRLSSADVHKADPKHPDFNKMFLGAPVLFDGCALNQVAQPTKAPVPLVQADGISTTLASFEPMYLPTARVWPEDIEGSSLEPYMGLGVSGVLYLPDGTGASPMPEGVDPAGVAIPVRPGGDSFPAPQSLGLIRSITDTLGDSILFSRDGAVTTTTIVDRDSDVPPLPFSLSGGTAVISREATVLPTGDPASLVQIGSQERKLFAGQAVYFLQASLTPATYTTQARIYSQRRIIFRFEGTEVLYFAIGGTAHDWHANTLPVQDFYSAEEVATSIQARITAQGGTGVARAEGDRLLLETANPNSGVVEIGWGTTQDLSGAAALGFLPGWRAKGGKPNWLPDAGISLGLARSLLNLDRSKADADYRARTRLEDVTLQESIPPSPFVFLDYPPVEDVAGFDQGVFFNLQTVALQGEDIRIIDKRLEHFEDIQHRFFEGKFAWLEQAASSNAVQTPTSTLALGNSGVVPESLLGAPGIGGGLYAAESGGRYIVQEQGVDYLLPESGLPGVAQLVTRYGARVLFGAQGQFTQGGTTFTDPQATFLADSTDPDIDPATGQQRVDPQGDLVWLPMVRPGFRLKIASGGAAGSYIVTSVTDNTHFEVAPPFIASASRATPWEVFSGIEDTLYDPAIVADVVYKPFNHLVEEPFKIRVLSPLGTLAANTVDFEAFVEDAVSKGRPISLRFGPVHPGAGVEATLTPLALTDLGVLANNQLVLPWTTHVSEGAFTLQVGTVMFTPVPVAAFSVDPVSVEYLTAAWDDGSRVHPQGEVKFNSTLLTDLESSQVVLVETLRAAAALPSGQAEYNPRTGDIRVSAADAATHSSKMLYFVEQMITTGQNRDVAVSPILGAVSFVKPLSAGCLVEMTYWLATSEGRRVGEPGDTFTEFLPVFVRREEAVRLTDKEFELDSTGRNVWADGIDPIVYIGPTQQNFGTEDFLLDQPKHLLGRRLTFNRALPTWVTPVATYAVYNCQGGERAFSTSQRPVYRPPFFIPAGKDNFGLRGNRVADFEPGQMLRIGAECFYITQLRYFAPTDVTRVDIYPSTTLEVGSRSPGNDVLTVITSVPIATTVTPPNLPPVTTTAKAGFMSEIPTTEFPFETINARQATVTFLGDLTQFAVPGHILEVNGMPFTIAQVTLSEDGSRTKVACTSAFQTAIDARGTGNTIKLSYRPVYPPEVREFTGKGPVVRSEGVELTLFGEVVDGVEQPGRQLAAGTEYDLDTETGVVRLLSPLQAPLGPGQRLLLSYTQMRVMSPFYSGGKVVFPRWAASYRYNTLPTTDNGFLGGRLTATYTFDNPDSFYFRALPLRSYLPEALKQALDEMKQWQSATSGPRLTISQGQNNWDQGNLGLLAQRRDLLDKDRAARAFLGFYNDAILAFEQVEETITGEFIGDRDGKFRFWVGTGLEFAPPGYEDDITGELNPANIWNRVLREVDSDPTRDLTVLPYQDPLVLPDGSCTMTDLVLSGTPIPSSLLGDLITRQDALVQNDVDDIVLRGASKPTLVPTTVFPYFTFSMKGIYDRMGQPHGLSRLYPTSAAVFFTLQPGIGADPATGDPGVYAWRRVNPNTGEAESTTNTQIGQASNPVLGAISDISEKTLRPRLPRARIWGYFPDGIPAGAFGSGPPTPAITKPCMVLSAVSLSKTPIHPATGYPDSSRFLSVSPTGDTPDAVAGDPAMALPGFKAGDKVAFGKPDGSLLAAVFPEELDLFGLKLFTSVFVDEVLYGCVVTFKNRHGDPITTASDLMVALTSNSGVPADEYPIGRADTLWVVPPDVDNPIADPTTDSATVEMQQQAAAVSPAFRMGFDLTMRTDGQVRDLSLPSWADPFLFPVKELLGQKPPAPLSHVEGTVEFANTHQVPLNTPALRGEPQDDAGDYQIPYRKGTATELDRFDEIGSLLGSLMARDPVLGGYYPDEVLFDDGEVVAAAAAWKTPATLLTSVNVLPAPTYGVAPGRPGDFVLVEVDPGAPTGWQGLLSVGALQSDGVHSWVEPPRFVTQTNKGSVLQYHLKNYAVFTTPGFYPVDPQVQDPPGVRLFEDTGPNRTVISLQDVPVILNDGVVVGVGNLNTIWAADPNNIVRIKILSRPDNTAINAPLPAGPGGYTNAVKDGRVVLTISITAGSIRVEDWQGNINGPLPHAGAFAGNFDPLTGELPVPVAVADYRHIIIDGITGAIFGGAFAPAGPAAQWFIPQTTVGTLTSTLYGFEVAVDVDCRTGGSTSGFVDADRLTFHEALDLEGLSRPRGFLLVNPNTIPPGYNYETGLRVTNVTLGTTFLDPINDVIGDYLTFLNRTNALSDKAGGTWTSAPSPNEDGTLKVMAFEEGNNSITAQNIVAAVQASQTLDISGVDILATNGLARRNQIVGLVPGTPLDVSRVQKGDVVYIDRSNLVLPDAATKKAGTYIVRHAVQADAGLPYKAVTASAFLGSGGGFLPTVFPKVVSIDVAGQWLVLDDYSMLPAAGKVFILLDRAALDSADPAVFQKALLSIDFIGLPGPFGLPLGGFATWRWADDSPIAAPLVEVTTALVAGKSCSWHDTPVGGAGPSAPGRMALPIRVRGGELPDDSSVVGFFNPGTSIYGFNALTFEHFSPVVLTAAAGIVLVPPAAGEARVEPAAVWPSGTFDPTAEEAVYLNVPNLLTVYLDNAQGVTLNNPNAHPSGGGVSCLLPGTAIRTENAGVPGFYALGGIFLEPSTPLQPLPLLGTPKVVDATRSLLAVEVGMRDVLVGEEVHFEVRRVRRWHGKQSALNDAFLPLKYAYEIRTGIVTAFTRNAQQVGLVTAAAGTNLGGFADEDVNIHPGDMFRILDTDGTVLDEGLVTAVLGDTQLKIAAPALRSLTAASVVGKTFEVYLRQVPVPHQQSNEQLLDLITDRMIHETVADRTDPDPTNWVGGYVPEVPDGLGSWLDICNILYDDSATPVNFLTKGVKKGDVVVIDPAGAMQVSPGTYERGFRPLGDTSVPTRTVNGGGPSPHDPGAVSNLDDNRGFYRVKAVYADHLELDPMQTFAGTLGQDVILGGTRTNLVYAVYPTVNESVLCVENAEGQNDLRPTRKAVGGSYQTGTAVQKKHSIRPFSYRILRPTSMFSTEVVDTVLMMRERMLSLIELLGSVTNGARGGFYWDWQDQEHVEELGTPTDPESGEGLFPNRLVEGLLGETSVSPFCNNSTCLSLLDRRFWIHDVKLDSLRPDPTNIFAMTQATGGPAFDLPGGPYTAYMNTTVGGAEVRPVLTDHLDLILDARDRLRGIRYTWLTYRAHRFRGSLAQIAQFDAEYPRRLADRQRALLFEATASKVTT